jgi:hypothetical protein
MLIPFCGMSHLIPVSLQAHQQPANLQVTNCGPAHDTEAKIMLAADSVERALVLEMESI